MAQRRVFVAYRCHRWRLSLRHPEGICERLFRIATARRMFLRVDDVPTPVPGDNEVLVRIKAVSVNARDWHVMRGEPRLARLPDSATFGRIAPKVRIRGTDFAGTVESVGGGVTRWRPGDHVFGESGAAIAEYVAAPDGVVATMPAGIGFEQAAAVPLAANTALVCLRAGQVGGTERLINGASGGVGTFAVQLAKSIGVHLTAVCSARNADLARSLGADVVVDYSHETSASRVASTTWCSTSSATARCATSGAC